MQAVPGATIERLILYHHLLEQLDGTEEEVVSSLKLGKGVGVTATQVRKDLSYFGSLGCKGLGYRIGELKKELERIIGFHKYRKAVLVGAGNLGRALVQYQKFQELGLHIREVFDCDLRKIGNHVNGLQVRSIKELPGTIAVMGIEIAVLAVPQTAAQEVAETLVEAGIKAIWNFAPVHLKLNKQIIIVSEDLSTGIGRLLFNLQQQEMAAGEKWRG